MCLNKKTIIMTYRISVFLLALAILNSSCEDESPRETNNSIEVNLTVNEQFEYNTNISGDEEGVSISIQANHFDVSEMIRDESTNWAAVYRYQPELDFVGTDFVELKLSTGSDGASPSTNTKFIKISFTILK